MTSIRAGVVLALAGAACGEVVPDMRPTVVELRVKPNRDLDLLFVVDDSPSMLDKQTNLANNFPKFVERLQTAPGGLPNLHVGVVTTDMGTKASGSATPGPQIGQIGNGGCSGTGKGGALQVGTAPVTGRFLVDVEGAGGVRSTNYTGSLAEVFGTMAKVGAGGCGFEQPLAAMRTALDNHPSNAGFLRPEALLGVVFLADEDDCSAKSTVLYDGNTTVLGPLQSFRCTQYGVTCAEGGTTPEAMGMAGAKGGCAASTTSELLDPIEPYREFLLGLKQDARNIVVSGILGPTLPFAVELRAPPSGGTPSPALAHSCMYTGPIGLEVADPAVRFQSLFEGFPGRSAATSICQTDLSGGLTQIAELLRRSIGTGCVEVDLADRDPRKEGLQVDCTVEDVLGDEVTKMESCEENASARPCWQLQVDPQTCGSSPFPHLKLVVERDAAVDPETVMRLRCRVTP